MKVIKNINNNVSLCLDSQNREVIAFGKGVGFTQPSYEIELSKVDRTFYNIDDIYIKMIQDMDSDIIDIATKIVDYASNKINVPIQANCVFTLTDHIQFAIKRTNENMNIDLPILHDIQHLFEKEMEVGEYGVKLIQEQFNIYLPKEEEAYIALHILNNEEKEFNINQPKLDSEIIEEIIEIIEQEFSIVIDKNDFNYSRFVSHMHYLMKRGRSNKFVKSENVKLYESLKQSDSQSAICAERISNYLKENIYSQLTDEEVLYLMLHINRLCAREDCDR